MTRLKNWCARGARYVFMSMMLVVGLLFGLGGCTSNPVQEAETNAQRGFAAYGLFVILEEQGAALIQDPAIPDEAKSRIQSLDARLKPMADSMREAALLAQEVHEEVSAGETTTERLEVVNRRLQSWLDRFLPLLSDFESAVSG